MPTKRINAPVDVRLLEKLNFQKSDKGRHKKFILAAALHHFLTADDGEQARILDRYATYRTNGGTNDGV